MTDVNIYAARLLDDKIFLKKSYAEFYENTYSVSDICGVMTAETLSRLIKRARRNKKLGSILTDLLLYSDSGSINNENFNALISFPGKMRRNTYLSSIAHCDIAFYQLQILNRYPLSFEAFTALFYRICENDFFKDEDMRQILRENKDVTPNGIREIIEYARSEGIDNSKLHIAESWIE